MDATKRQAAVWRHQSRQLMAMADELDPPITPTKATPVARLICPDCGTEYAGPEYRSGDACLTVMPSGRELCQGFIGYKSDPARDCSCDRCGLRLAGAHLDGRRCNSSGPELGICWGTFRLDPEPDLVQQRGEALPITVGELAYQMAVRDFVVGGTDDLPIPGLDIASTYRGGRSSKPVPTQCRHGNDQYLCWCFNV